MKKIIYLSGPITNMANNNYEEFKLAQEKIESLGHKVLNPHDLCEGMAPEHHDHMAYMRVCISAMAFATEVVTLKDWEFSKGANQEVNIARIMQIPVTSIIKFLE